MTCGLQHCLHLSPILGKKEKKLLFELDCLSERKFVNLDPSVQLEEAEPEQYK